MERSAVLNPPALLLHRKLAILLGGFYRNKEEVLEKSRAENRKKGIYEQEVLNRANACALIVMVVLTVVFLRCRYLLAAVQILGIERMLLV